MNQGTPLDQGPSFSHLSTSARDPHHATPANSLSRQFISYFEALGYLEVESEPLVPRTDESVLFSGSSIMPFKGNIQNNAIPQSGLSVIQPCLRFHDAQKLFAADVDDYTLSYFHMAGTIVNHHSIEALHRHAASYLRTELKLAESRIRLLTTSALPIMKTHLLKEIWGNTEIIEDSKKGEFYEWKYGMGTIRGVGLTILLEVNGEFKDFGNIIEIVDRSHVIGAEFAFGIEAALSRLGEGHNFIKYSNVASVVPFKGDIDTIRLLDTLQTTVCLLRAGVLLGNRMRGHILKRMLKGLEYYAGRRGISDQEVVFFSQSFQELEFGNNIGQISQVIPEYFKNIRDNYENSMCGFRRYLSKQIEGRDLSEPAVRRAFVQDAFSQAVNTFGLRPDSAITELLATLKGPLLG